MLGLASQLTDQGDVAEAQLWLERWQLAQSGSRVAPLTSTEAHILGVLDERVSLDEVQIASRALIPLGAVREALNVLSLRNLIAADDAGRYFRLSRAGQAT
jgi:hypothetical protein